MILNSAGVFGGSSIDKITYEDFDRDMDRDTFMSSQEALAYGLCDKIVESR